ncbi:uncharacterized protein [Rutidosis leptorrhynchoides]|uniref:uncharacterized protein n=1 Tax=Rutidosis leptorrhynchoides TaxID=125765 RepID=UPI003A98D270
MDPHSFIARAEAQRWIGIAEKLLISHDLVGSKTFAIRARESDPRLEAADQILAIADTLLAAEKRLVGSNGNQQPDYYAILQLVQFVQDSDHITSQYRRLAVILNPHHNRFPYSDQAFQLINDAWAVLSNPMRKSMYDSQLDFGHQQQQHINNLGFNIQQHQHQHHSPNQHHHHQQQQQQQQQHNFFSINQELAEPQQTFQTRLQPSHQQHNFLSQPNVAVREPQEQMFHHQDQQEQLFQPQVQPFQVTSTPHQQTRPPSQPAQSQPPLGIQSPSGPTVAATQSPFSWPQAPPVSQSQQQTLHFQQQEQQNQTQQQQQQEQQRQQHQDPIQQNAAPVELPSQVNSNVNGVNEEETEAETEAEPEEVGEDVDDDSPTFWTTCPFCFYMYEYPSVYADCTLRCDNCNRAFQAVRISSPPAIVEGQEAYFYSWGFYPIGVSMSHLQSKNKKVATPKWTPFSPLYDALNNVQNHLNEWAAPKENTFVNKSSGPRIYIDDYTNKNDVFIGISEPSDDDSDVEWGSTLKRRLTVNKQDLVQRFKERVQVLALRAIDPKNGGGIIKKSKVGIPVQKGVGVPTAPVAEAIQKTVVNSNSRSVVSGNPRKQSVVVAKEMGKLDLNVEFNNNEGEEAAPPRMASGARGHMHGDEENIEGIGFFEGLDEFLNSLPIISVVNEEKVKAAAA